MKRKIFALILVLAFILPCAFFVSGCGKKGSVWQGQITTKDPDSVTNYWIEYSQNYSRHPLRTMAKATKDGVTYYYMEYGNNGNWNETVVKLDANGHYKAYTWDNNNSTWVSRYAEDHPECAEGNDWFNYKAQFYSDYFADALGGLAYTGEVNYLIRYENGTAVKNMGTATWTTIGYDCGYDHPTHVVDVEEIENCLHFYDEQEDEHYYFAPETHFLLCFTDSSVSGRTTKVYKRHFDMNNVLAVHDRTTTGLPFTLPEV